MLPLPKVRRYVGFVLHGLVAALLVFTGAAKVLAFPQIVEKLAKFGLGDRVQLIGIGEALAAILLLVPLTRSLGVLLMSAFWGA